VNGRGERVGNKKRDRHSGEEEEGRRRRERWRRTGGGEGEDNGQSGRGSAVERADRMEGYKIRLINTECLRANEGNRNTQR
jgi:hypothetical protein